MTTEVDNPAERLYRLLNAALSQPSSNKPTSEVWAEVLNVEHDDLKLFMQEIIELYKLFDDVEKQLLQIEGVDKSLFVEPVSSLKRALPMRNLSINWESSRGYLREVDMRSLRHAAYELSKQPLPPKISDEQLAELSKDITELYEKVAAAPIPEVLKTLILNQLASIQTAIHLYRVRGAIPLHEALVTSAGTLVTYWPLFEQYGEAEAVSGFKKLVQKLTVIIPVAADSSTLIGSAIAAVKLLLPGG